MITKIKAYQKCFGLARSWDSEIDCIAKVNRWNKVIFSCWYEFRKAKSRFNDFWVGVVKNGHGGLVDETLKSVVS